MRISNRISALLFISSLALSNPIRTNSQLPFNSQAVTVSGSHNVSLKLFASLEEFARIVDIAYCVGLTGIQAPFQCVSRCEEFPEFQLVDTWNTGLLMSDSCGYIALDHSSPGRIILAFRGTYSIANTIVDLSTIPQEYIPYPGDSEEALQSPNDASLLDYILKPWTTRKSNSPTNSEAGKQNNNNPKGPKCTNCTVHSGFLSSWTNTRSLILPHLKRLRDEYPAYELHLVGHSLGGAVAALAALELEIMGWKPTVTTFGEPRIGNEGLRTYIDEVFGLEPPNSDDVSGFGDVESRDGSDGGDPARFRRVTHVDDPVPLLPLAEWGFRMHAGEIYIQKPALSPMRDDLYRCMGNEDPQCIAGPDSPESVKSDWMEAEAVAEAGHDAFEDLDMTLLRASLSREDEATFEQRWGLPARYKMWQLFFAHRDYFWRLGLCVPGGDPFNWGREKYGPYVSNPDPE